MSAPYIARLSEDGAVEELIARHVQTLGLERKADGLWILSLRFRDSAPLDLEIKSSKPITVTVAEPR